MKASVLRHAIEALGIVLTLSCWSIGYVALNPVAPVHHYRASV